MLASALVSAGSQQAAGHRQRGKGLTPSRSPGAIGQADHDGDSAGIFCGGLLRQPDLLAADEALIVALRLLGMLLLIPLGLLCALCFLVLALCLLRLLHVGLQGALDCQYSSTEAVCKLNDLTASAVLWCQTDILPSG